MRVSSIDDILAGSALSLGVGQMLISMKRVYEYDDVSYYSVPHLLIGILGSMLWLTVQYRSGANYSSIYTSIALVSQLYILQRVVSKLKTKRDAQ